ncbi:MAG TPA: acyl-CoA dehydrogenase family protein [Polyangiales bacterium]|jgi:hypothetical protein|nr:acyl-CoA dehydrogenase family protein [Polyangiales bacterium]
MPNAAKPLFDLTLTEEQVLMRETARRFADTQLRPAARKCDEAADIPRELYDRSLELGVNAVQIPEALGGFGAPRSPISNMLLIEDLARGDMALALGVLSSLSFVSCVLDHGSEAQRSALLAPFAGEAFHPAAVALAEPGTRFDPAKLATRARKSGGGYVLSGEKTLVPFGADAELLLVIAAVEGEGPAAFVVKRGQAHVSFTREAFMGLRPLALHRMRLQDAEVPASARLGEGAAFDLGRMVDLARIGAAALAVGTCQAVLDYAKAYCNERVAFGEPITHRQSVAFMIADMAIELDGMRLLAYRAASRAEQGLSFHREAYLARLQAVEKGMKIGTDGVQLLGGHGFIREHMVELWYRNLRAVNLLEGMLCV